MIYLIILTILAFMFGGGCANDILQGQVETAKENEVALRRQLEETQKQLVLQDEQNQELIRRQALSQRDSLQRQTEWEERTAELASQNQKLEAANLELSTRNDVLSKNLDATEEKFQRNVSFQKIPTVSIVPNNSELRTALKIDDPEILPIRRDEDRVIIEIQDDLLFEPGTLTLSEPGQKRLQKIADEVARTYPNNIYNIVGHTDDASRNGEDALQEYSIRKAGIVLGFLIDQTGVKRNQFVLTGSGSVRPIVANETESNRRRNRRVEWIIIPTTVY